jgi:hypothetical protein
MQPKGRLMAAGIINAVSAARARFCTVEPASPSEKLQTSLEWIAARTFYAT